MHSPSSAGKRKTAGRRRGRPADRLETSSRTRQKSARRRNAAAAPAPIRPLHLIKQNPGITASEIAEAMKIKPNYLYRVLSDLEKQKRVKKKGRTLQRRVAAPYAAGSS